MNLIQVTFGGVQLYIPPDWGEITEGAEAPFTLAKNGGEGALQFSPALYRSGQQPNITTTDLVALLQEFSTKKNLNIGPVHAFESGNTKFASADGLIDGDRARVWYCSDGANALLITYVHPTLEQNEEVNQCEQIVKSVQFTNS